MSRPHLLDVLRERVLLCDGGMGSHMQGLSLQIHDDYWGRENCTDLLNLSRPDLVREVHRGFFAVGADLVETNSFGASPKLIYGGPSASCAGFRWRQLSGL